jgi:hypothetical protein
MVSPLANQAETSQEKSVGRDKFGIKARVGRTGTCHSREQQVLL